MALSEDDVFSAQGASKSQSEDQAFSLSENDVFGSPSLRQYGTEAALAVGRGALQTAGSTLEGFGAQIPEVARQRIEALQASQNAPPSPDEDPNTIAAYRLSRQRHLTPEVAAERIAADQPMAETRAQDTSLFKAGQAIGNALPASQQILNPVLEDVLGGIGSVGTNIATSMIPGAGPGLTVASTLGQGAGEAAENAIKAGASEQDIAKSSSLGQIAGATEFADTLLPKLGSTGKALSLIKRVGLRAFEGALTEGGQEGLQQFIQNLISQKVYNPDQSLSENVVYNAVIGALVGGPVTALLGGHSQHGGTTEQPTSTQGPPAQAGSSDSLQGFPVLTDEQVGLGNSTSGSVTAPLNTEQPLTATPQQAPGAPPIPGQQTTMPMGGRDVPAMWIEFEGEMQKAPVILDSGIKEASNNYGGPGTLDRGQVAEDFRTVTMPNLGDPYSQFRIPGFTAKVAGEAQQVAQGFAQAADQIVPIVSQYEPSVQLPISDQQDLERAQTQGTPPVEGSIVPETTLSSLPPNALQAMASADSSGATAFELDREQFAAKNGLPPLTPEDRIRLIAQRIRQIEYDRRLGGKPEGERYPHNVELSQLRSRLKELQNPVARPMEGGQQALQGQVLPPVKTVRIFEGPDDQGNPVNINIESEHMAYAQQWLDHIQPNQMAVGAWSDLAPVIQRSVINRLRQVLPPALQVHMVSDAEMERNYPGRHVNGFYLSGSANRLAPTIAIRSSLLMQDPARFSHVLLHEMIHAATTHALEQKNAIGSRLRTEVNLLMVETMNGLVQRTGMDPQKMAMPPKIAYAFTNEHEFLAEALSNTELQMILAELPASRELTKALGLPRSGPGRTSLWNALVHFIHRVLGMPFNSESYTMLEATLRISESAIDAQNRLPHPVDLRSPAYEIASKQNRVALSKESPNLDAHPHQPEVDGLRRVTGVLFAKQPTPIKIQQAMAHADSMNWLYKWMGGLSHLTNANPNHTPLMEYKEIIAAMHRDEVRIHDAAVRLGKDWHLLGDERGAKISALIDDLAHMRYRSQYEVTNHLVRHPSRQEMLQLIQKHNLTGDTDALDLFKRITQMISGDPTVPGRRGFIGLIEDAIIGHLQRTITDPVQLANRTAAVQRQVQALRARPYFPFTNFGRHYILVRDPTGKLVHFETVERSGLKSAERVQRARQNELARNYQQQYNQAPTIWTPGMDPKNANVVIGLLPEHAGPLLGLPAPLLEHIQATMQLTPEQINVASELAQAQALNQQPILAQRFQRKFFLPGYGLNAKGYSEDLKRSFARFMFHGGKFWAKAKHMDDLRNRLKEASVLPGVKEGQISEFMKNHFQATVEDAKGDWGFAKGMIFLWALGYVPAAATQNLSQTPLITLPFLGAKFGEVKATAALSRAMRSLSSYYKYGTYQNSNQFEYKALEYAIRTGRISETQAPELAGMSQATLLTGIGGNRAQRMQQWTMQKSAWMFEMAEQWNRRIAFRAALDLAQKNPQAKFNQEAVNLHKLEYQQLIREGFAPSQAQAILAAVHAVDQTQFVYARWDRARFMRGKKSIVFVFQRYAQSMAFMLGQNPDVFWRYALIMMFVGGLGGLPGMEDLLSIVKGLGAKMGKDWNVEHHARKYITELFDGTVDPDIVLHGFARRGMGIPWLLDAMGSFATGTPGRGLISKGAPVVGRDPETGQPVKQNFAQNVPFPVVDRSKAYGTRFLPFDLGKMLTPADDVNRPIAEQAQRASGAFFSVGFNMYKAIQDNQLAASDWKRWERAMPRLAGDASKMFRAFTEGRERTRGGPAGGSTVVSYDTRDTEQMMEAIAIGMGYQTIREQSHWDNVMAQQELVNFYKIQREGLLQSLYEAKAGQNDEEFNSVREAIKQFNRDLPEWARGSVITSDTAQKSLEARLRGRALREAGIPAQKGNIPLAQELNRLYPESVIDVRRR